jgi:hypothetical protein
MDAKYLVTTGIALVALLVSIIVAYLTNIRRLEELRAVSVDRLVLVFEDDRATQIILPVWVQLAFINTGNTSIGVTGASAALGHSAEQKVSSWKDCGDDVLFETDLQPFVLKQEDVAIKKVTLLPDINYRDKTHKTDKSLSVDVTDAIKTSAEAILCMRFNLATSSDPLAFGQLVLGRYGFAPVMTTSIRVKFPMEPNIVWHAAHFFN